MRVKNTESFWSLLPIGYFLSEYEAKDSRIVEIDAEFRIVFCRFIAHDFLKGAVHLSSEEQNILDCEISTMQFGFEGSTVLSLMKMALNRNEVQINKSLDKIDAKYHTRNLLGLEPTPPRRYDNKYSSYWSNYFGMAS